MENIHYLFLNSEQAAILNLTRCLKQAFSTKDLRQALIFLARHFKANPIIHRGINYDIALKSTPDRDFRGIVFVKFSTLVVSCLLYGSCQCDPDKRPLCYHVMHV